MRRKSRVALILGAGGISGGAFEAGTLLALEDVTGWDPASADLFVGTSAGSWIATFLGFGFGTRDFWADLADDGVAQRAESMRSFTQNGDLYTPNLMPNLCDPRTYLLPHAPFTTEGMQRFLSAQLPDEGTRWPDKNVKVVAYEIFRNRRAVLSAAGRAQPRQAVAASSCIPLLFRPVSVGCSMYIDGGVHSTTNADVAVNEDIDLAICVAPMAIAPGDRPKSAGRAGSLLGPMADSARRSLYAEIADLKRARPEMDVLVVRPNKAEVGAMGSNPMNPRSEMPTLHAARANAREKFSNPDVRHILEKHGIAA